MKHSKALASFLRIWPSSINDLPGYLGPNWETIFNFWTYIDTLTVEQWDAVGRNYDSIRTDDGVNNILDYGEEIRYARDVQYSTWYVASVIGGNFDAKTAAIHVSYEMLAMDILLTDGHKLHIIPLFSDL